MLSCNSPNCSFVKLIIHAPPSVYLGLSLFPITIVSDFNQAQ
jgi:hypothetical protein